MWHFLLEFWPYLLGTVDVLLATAATMHAVLWKRDSRAVIAWVGLAWLAPLVGSLAYFFFGINRIQRKALALGLRESWAHADQSRLAPHDVARRDEITHQYPNLIGLATLVRGVTERPLLPGNRIESLVNGDQAYPEMLRAIGQAERSVALLSYIFDSDRTGDDFLQALVAARDRGVEVRVLIDDMGSRYSRPNMIHRLRNAGLQAVGFLPSRVPWFFKYANLRNHRKIMVTDGRIGFTGGTNIRDGHCLRLKPKSPASCLHFRVEGPVVSQMQEAFATDWAFASGESLGGDVWFPEIEPVGESFARGVPDGPDEDFEKMQNTILGALTAATKIVRIVTPYFLPNASIIDALNVTAMRGVEVQILVPAQNNIPFVQWAMTAQLWQLLQRQCRVYLSPPPFDHTKLLIVDDIWTLLGSTNWDQRSLRLNFEFNIECYDSDLAAELATLVDEKISNSREVTLEQVYSRTLPVRLRDGLARMLTPYL